MKTKLFSRKSILSAFLAVTTAVLLYSATGQELKDDTPGENNIFICHRGKMMMIDKKVWPVHKAHGDHMGPCEPEPPIRDPHHPGE